MKYRNASSLILTLAMIGCGSENRQIVGSSNGAGSGGRPPAEIDAEQVEQLVGAIDTQADPSYVYAFEGAKFVPPEGRTLLIMGQTLDGIAEHVASFPDQPVPGGWAAYWGIPSMAGVDSTSTGESGSTHNHQELVDRYPNTVLQSGLWMVGTWDVAKRTAAGEYDSVIRDFSAWAKAADRPIYLRIGYEFDGPHNELEPTDYVAAYRHIVDIMREEQVTNVAFVWHSYASPPYQGYDISAWYPGDDYADWMAITMFSQAYNLQPGRYVDAVFEFAREKKKPVMIAESSPIGGIRPDGSAAWNSWFANLFSLAYERNVKAITIINENWQRFNFPGTDWADARLQNNPLVSAAFFAETNKDRYLKQSPELFDQLGYAP
ncbi:MAG: hypothetical protein AAF627_20405 [Myxococcota bacterium]